MQGQQFNLKEIMEAANTPDIDCKDVDLQEVEQMGVDIVKSVNDYIMNIDITDTQFDVEGLYEASKKIGLDAGDLAEYGFDFKSAKCNGKTCFNPKNLKDYDDFVNKSEIFSKKMMKSGSQVYKKASCHPFMQKHVVPKV